MPRPLPHSVARLLACLACLAAGCNGLPPGPIEAVGMRSAAPRRGHVYLLRGWRGLWSEGIDGLAAELRAAGVEAHVYHAGQAAALGNALVSRYRGVGDREPLVLVGFSFGADEAIRVARKLGGAGVPVELLVTLDPVTPPPIPANVKACENFYQSNGAWDALPWLRGVPVKAGDSADEQSNRLTNTNIRQNPGLAEDRYGHDTIAANPKLHRAIIESVLRVCPPKL